MRPGHTPAGGGKAAPPPSFPLAFAWAGLPDYAARCLRAVDKRHPGRVHVLGTRSSQPIRGMEASLGRPVTWIDGANRTLSWPDLGLNRPGLFFQGGYHHPAFRSLGRDCRAHGGRVVCLSDANWQATLGQLTLAPLRHRLILNRAFDGLLVPGRAGHAHARVMGWPPDRVRGGMLGADPALFGGGEPLARRPREILFVGRLVPEKNVLALARAFLLFAADHPGWRLRICGTGPLAERLPRHPAITVHGFLQPAELAPLYRRARCFVLPSLREPWGLVVHEAALSGCALALSERVGAAADLATPENAVLFRPRRDGAVEAALRGVAAWDEERWARAERASRAAAAQFGPKRFADAVDAFVAQFQPGEAPC